MPPSRSLTLLFTVPGILSPPYPLPLTVTHSPTWTTQLSLPTDTLSLTIVFSTALTVLVLLLSASPMRVWAPRWSSNFSMLFPALSPHTAQLVGCILGTAPGAETAAVDKTHRAPGLWGLSGPLGGSIRDLDW